MQRTRLHAIVVLALLAVAGASVNVSAQPSRQGGTPSPEVVKRADASFRIGNQLYTDKKWAEAEAAFLAAWELNPTYDVAANLGNTQSRLGKYREAAEHLTFALRNWPLIGSQEPRKLAQDRLAEARVFVASLKIQAPVDHVDVSIDGKFIGRTPLDHEVFVDAGSHKIEGKHDVEGTETIVVKAEKGSTQTVQLTLGHASRAPAASASAVATAAPGGSSVPPPPVVPEAEGPRAGILIGGGAAAGAALISGVVFTVLANGKSSAVTEKNSEVVKAMGAGTCVQPVGGCGEVAALIHQQADFSNVALWSFIGAGALGAATGVYALVARSAPKAGPRAVPVVTAHGGGIVVGGVW